MTSPSKPLLRLAALLVTSVLLQACSLIPKATPDSTRYFTLELPSVAKTEKPQAGALRLHLRSMELASYLRKGALALRQTPTEIKLDETKRWAEPLDKALCAQLLSQLSQYPEFGSVTGPLRPGSSPADLELHLSLYRAEGLLADSGATILFTTRIELVRTADRTCLVELFQSSDIPWDPQDPASLASGISKAGGLLAEHIRSMVKNLQATSP